MTIKHPSASDLPRLRTLWQAAFGDTADFIDGFFRTGFSESRCMLAEENDQLLAALYWFDCLWEGRKLAYLYAIATDEAHRGKGICRALMAHTHDRLVQNGYCGAILVPADEGLARMYGKMGYTACCLVAKPSANAEKPEGMEEISPMEYMALRRGYLPEGAVHHTKSAYRYLATFQKFYRFPSGICCGSWDEEGLRLQELLGASANPGLSLRGAKGDMAISRTMYLSFTDDTARPAYFALDMG